MNNLIISKKLKLAAADEAIKSLVALEKQADSAKTYEELEKIVDLATATKAVFKHVTEVRQKAEWVILQAWARVGDEIGKVPKAPGGQNQHRISKPAKSVPGRTATGIPGYARARFLKLSAARAAGLLKRLATAAWDAGKEATVSTIIRDLRNERIKKRRADHDARADKGGKIKDLQELIAQGKKFSVIYLDPPWAFKVWGNAAKGNKGGMAENHYRTMTIEEMKKLPIAQLAEKHAVIIMWVVNPEIPGALELLKAWGLEYKTVAFTWVKTNRGGKGWFFGMGYWTRANPEQCFLATRGSPERDDPNVEQLLVAPVGRHSEKPKEAYERIEKLLVGPYLELFGRKTRPGWTVWGGELPSLAQQVAEAERDRARDLHHERPDMAAPSPA